MQTNYTLDNLINNRKIRANFMRDYDKLIRGLKKHGFNASAMKHARNKQRIADEIALLD